MDIQKEVTLEVEVYVPPVVVANLTTTTPNPMAVEDTLSPDSPTVADSAPITNTGDPVSTPSSDRSEQSSDSTKKSYPKHKRHPVIPSW